MEPQTVLIHDYAGHPFQAELSRYLARAWKQFDINVIHSYSASTHTPQATLHHQRLDPENLKFLPISLGKSISKYSFIDRFRMERLYGAKLIEVCDDNRITTAISGNTPSLAQVKLVRWGERNSVPIITWIQDMYGVAAKRILSKKIPLVGGLIGDYFIHLDKVCYKSSNRVVAITPDFESILRAYGVLPDNIVTIKNWAPLQEVPQVDRDNDWAAEYCDATKSQFIYSGTLSIRHNPELLLQLAKTFEAQDLPAELIVVSEGAAADALRRSAQSLSTLKVLPFQPFNRLPQVLAAADVLIAILEPDAGVYCVPSKVLTYMCAGRAILTAIPAANLAARLIAEVGVGHNVEPNNINGFVNAARELLLHPKRRFEMGQRARAYAEHEFDINRIAPRFADILGFPLN